MRQDVKWVLENNNPTSSKDVLGQGEAAGQRNASSDSVHTAKYNSSLCNCILLAMELWTNLHSSTQMKEIYPNMASMVQIPTSKGFFGNGME